VTDPRVTVLLAVFNGGAYLREAVDSVLAQTLDDFELLVVDDASTDGVVDALPADPRIRILRNERNIGQIPSLNRGLRDARGAYVARLDHDDLCLPRRLELQVNVLERFPDVALVGTWVDVVSMSGRIWTRLRPELHSFAHFAAQVVTGHIFLVHPSLTFRRDVVIGVGGFDEDLNAAEDQELYRRLVLARGEARVVPETLVRYRRHEQQMTYAKTAIVEESDARSHSRFLAALDPSSPAETLRLLVRSHPGFWSKPPLAERALDDFVAAASGRLSLDEREREVMASAIAQRAVATLVDGWAGGASEYARRARPLAAFAGRHGDGRTRAVAAATPILAATAPIGKPVAAVRIGAARVLRSDALATPRRIARTSRALRTLYMRIADTRRHGA
jgi:glycosyltransferase involved in cell wall biosynthesis